MTMAEQLRKEGREEGLQRQRATLRKQLTLKFGALAGADERIEVATLEQLDRCFERVLTAESLDEVFG